MSGGGRRHGRPSSAPSWGGSTAEPTLFELSQPGRSSWQLRTTGMPEWGAEELVPAEHIAVGAGPVGRGLRA